MVKNGFARYGTGCAVSEDFRFIYIHVLKSGGMSIKATLRAAMCDGGRFDDVRKECAREAGGRSRLSIQNCADAVQKPPGYTVFSFVRSPFHRWYSAYAMGA